MTFTSLEFGIILFFVVFSGVAVIISAWGWLVEYTKRKQLEQKRKDFFAIEMALLNSTSIYDKDYAEYFMRLEREIKKERKNRDVYL